MPIYEYACKQCGYRFEQLQKSSDVLLATCPSCKAESLTKLISSAGFQLKGTGWYATDFKNKKTENNKSTEPQTTPVKDDGTKSEIIK